MQPEICTDDVRKHALDQWVSDQLGTTLSGESASADASFRRYFRYQHNGTSYVAMDAPPETEDCRPFVDVAERLQGAGIHVPRVFHQDLENGFLLLSDLGHQTWLNVLNDANADDLFSQAIDALIAIQVAAPTDGLPHYDDALLERELQLFPQWFLFRHHRIAVKGEWRQRLDRLFGLLIKAALAQPKVFVHRDFMPRNLMLSAPNPGVIDFQDAVSGPITYDVISLFKDAFISWPEGKVLEWLAIYYQRAQAAGLPLPGDFDQFLRDCDLMGAQRHIKVMGIFARICHRDGKPQYLADVPRFHGYLRQVVQRRPELSDLSWVLDRLEEL